MEEKGYQGIILTDEEPAGKFDECQDDWYPSDAEDSGEGGSSSDSDESESETSAEEEDGEENSTKEPSKRKRKEMEKKRRTGTSISVINNTMMNNVNCFNGALQQPSTAASTTEQQARSTEQEDLHAEQQARSTEQEDLHAALAVAVGTPVVAYDPTLTKYENERKQTIAANRLTMIALGLPDPEEATAAKKAKKAAAAKSSGARAMARPPAALVPFIPA